MIYYIYTNIVYSNYLLCKGDKTVIMSYSAKDIQVLKGLEPVRVRPAMYIGNTNRVGLNHLVQEIIDNSVDEHLVGHCDTIKVKLNKDGSATISDNGRGIPVDIHETEGICAERVILTTLHAGGKFSENAYKISGGLHGVGTSVVNALSNKLIVEVVRGGYLYVDEYEKGIPKTKLTNGLLPKVKTSRPSGTTMTIYPDDTIFENIKFKASAIRQRIKETAYLNPNLTLIFHNERDGFEEEIYHEPEGIVKFVKDISADLVTYTPVISISGEKNGISADISFIFSEDGDENIVGFTNNITNTEGGTHINGFKSAFAKLINTYARNDLGLLKDKDSNFNGSDIRNGLIAIISVKHPDPQFEGQTKTKLGSSDVIKAMEDIVKEQLTVYFDRNVTILENICNHALAISKKKSNEKVKLTTSRFSFEGNGKLARQESNDADLSELFIVEGDSAGGSAKNARNRKYQAILSLRGKILNVEKAPISKVLANAEIKTIINALGCGFKQGYGNDFDISKINYKKIILMTDADVDGEHIDTLLLTFFYRFYPEIINAGYVYLAIPPLYRVDDGKNKQYLYSDEELEKYRKKTKKKFTIQRYKGLGEMDADQLFETTMDKESRILKQVSINNIFEANQVTETLMGNDVAPRKDFIILHSDEAVIDT